MNTLHRYWHWLWLYLFVYLLFGAVVRLGLLWLVWDFYVPSIDGPVTWAGVSQSLMMGAVNDLVAWVYLLLPLIGVILLSPWLGRFALPAFISLLLLIVSVFLIIFGADLGTWFAFGVRVNRLFFHYLNFPFEVVVYLQEQLYLAYWAVALFVLLYWLYRWVTPFAQKLFEFVRPMNNKSILLSIMAIAMLALPWAVQFSVVVSHQDRLLHELSKNAFMNLAFVGWVNVTDWHRSYPQLDEFELAQEAAKRAILLNKNAQSVAHADLSHIKHVILIVEESFAGKNWWDLEKRSRYMPSLQVLSDEGVYFDNVYSTGTRTTRGLEAILHGYPPLPGIAVNQREGVGTLPSLPRQLRGEGFDNIFVYGGWPEFSQFSTYWKRIGYNKIFTREDFAEDLFETSWGVADENLFDKILREMDAEVAKGDKVFLSTLTVSNHRPFDVPTGRTLYPSERKLEYAIAYADWALGEFFRQAKEKPWYAETLFVITADHGPRIYGNSTIPVESYRVPVVILAEGLDSHTNSSLGSIMDIPTTILNLLDIDDSEGFTGGTLFSASHGHALVEHDYHIGMISQGGSRKTLTLVPPWGVAESWLLMDSMVDKKVLTDDAEAAALIGIFQATHAAFYTQGTEPNIASKGPG